MSIPAARPAPLLGNYYRSTEADTPQNAAYRRIVQAEALSRMLCGDSGEAFRTLNDDIQDNICWLLGDLIGEFRLFQHKAQQEATSKPMAHALAEELHKAHRIIAIALDALEGELRGRFIEDIRCAGLEGEGVTRANERASLLAQVGINVREVQA